MRRLLDRFLPASGRAWHMANRKVGELIVIACDTRSVHGAAAKKVADEFFAALNDLAGNHAMAVAGVAVTLERLEAVPVKPGEASMNLVGYDDPNSGSSFYWQKWPLATIGERLGPDGPVIRSIGQQWVVSVATQWNDHFRQRFADAEGVEAGEIKDPLMADMNRMRNDVIHHRGIATAKNTGRCEALRWFSAGAEIHVMPVHVVELMDRLGLVNKTSDFDSDSGPWEESEV